MTTKQHIILLLALLSSLPSTAWAMNFLRPYDTLLRPFIYPSKKWEVAVWAEGGVRNAIAFNDDNRVNVLQTCDCFQDAITMLDGFYPHSEPGSLRMALDASNNDRRGKLNDRRGKLFFDADLKLDFSAAIAGHWMFSPGAWLALYVPCMQMRLDNVRIKDQTCLLTPADYRTKELLTDDFAQHVCQLGGPDLGPWKRTGLGDIVLMLEGYKNFYQPRPMLKNVYLNGRLGFNLPTGKGNDENILLGLPFGWDAFGVIFGGGLGVNLGSQLRAGFDVQMTQLFGNTRERRIKTAPGQTQHLYLACVDAYKDYGLIQRFNLFAQAYRIYRGCSLMVGYQFLKHGEDSLSIKDCCYSNEIANTACELEEWTYHEAIVNLQYEWAVDRNPDQSWPQLSLFARLPFNGRRSVLFTTVGAALAIDF